MPFSIILIMQLMEIVLQRTFGLENLKKKKTMIRLFKALKQVTTKEVVEMCLI